MGYYINPPDMTKEEFLNKYGILIKESDVMANEFGNEFPVVLVDNGLFTAAGILYDDVERQSWWECYKRDPHRFYLFYIVAKKHLIPYLPEKI